MELYQYLTVESFLEMGKRSENADSFVMTVRNIMHQLPEENYMYGFSLLRKAIRRYEEKNNIPASESKEQMPFFRENSRVLVGPEMGFFVLPLYENNGQEFNPLSERTQVLSLTWDYEKLAEHCLLENLFLLKCKYDEEEVVSTFSEQLNVEYDKVFFNEEYTGFTRDSRFFSMLCNACLEVVSPEKAFEKEWRMTQFKPLSEAEYHYEGGSLVPSVLLSIPKECLKEVRLLNREEQPLLYGTLAGFMQQIGLAPDVYLQGMQD